MNNYDQWEARLSEYLDSPAILAHYGTLFAMWEAGATPPQAAQALKEIEARAGK